MSNNPPPYGGQPDPNATPWSGPPAQSAGYPGYDQQGQSAGYPGYDQPGQYQPPQYGASFPSPPPQKKNRGLVIGLSIGAAVVVLLALCGVGITFAVMGDDDDPKPVATASAPAPAPTDGTPQPGPSTSDEPDDEQPNNNNAMTARYSSDLSNVCEGSPILNAAAYNGPSGAKAYAFSNAPERTSSWSSKGISSSKRYYAKTTDFTSVSVVACLKFVEGSEGEPRACQYKDSSGKSVTVNYISSRYEMTFYAAKTGEKIGDGGTVNAPASRCPSFISYNKITMKSYAAPDSGTIEAALDKFLS
ncbi:hypothetical protein [Micromonospora okii]|uniref:hypothetical protein n=1 Tax=Micromonospora okii TaxID=1182970 RepID=UPI001E4963FD|nr:hypothetical protein [Micromonospora okii]